MISSIVAILAGLVLLAHWLKGRAAEFADTLAKFDVVIGVVAIVVGVLELLSLPGHSADLGRVDSIRQRVAFRPINRQSISPPGKCPRSVPSNHRHLILLAGFSVCSPRFFIFKAGRRRVVR